MWYTLHCWPVGRARRFSHVGGFSNTSELITRATGTAAHGSEMALSGTRIVMTETKNPGEKTLTVTPTKTLTLKRSVEQGVVRQSFSHGRTKAVVVEKVKRRTVSPGDGKVAETAPAATPASAPRRGAPGGRGAAGGATQHAPGTSGGKPSGVVLRQLTEEERTARAHALAESKVSEAEERRIAEEVARRREEKETAERTERDAAEARKHEEDERRRHDEEAKRKAETEAKKRFGDDETKPKTAAQPPGAAVTPISARRVVQEAEEEEAPRPARRGPGAARPVPAPKPARGGSERRRGRLTLVTALTADEVRERSVASFRRRTQRLKGHAANEAKEKLAREVTIPEAITIQELANRMSERAVDVIKLLMKQGQMAKITDTIDADTAQLLAEELGHSVRRVAESDVEEGLFDHVDDPAMLHSRPPVVTIMGHVDHGKTSLLDAIRATNVAGGEAGGITQHIGAYQVTSPLGSKITFIDTPGHAAFTSMRARGAKVTDIVVLVVAADAGVMPHVIEAKLDRGRGPVATVLVQRGTLRGGDIVVAGAEWGRVRALLSDSGVSVSDAGPSTPVEILGFNGTPEAGDRLAVVDSEARAREVTDYRARQKRDKIAARASGLRGSLEQMMSQLKTSGRKEFPLLIKGDVQGSVQAIAGALEKLGTTEVAARIILAGAGGISESDVTLAEASGAAIIGFNVRAHKEAREMAERDGVEIRYYNIIYDLVDDVKKAMSGLLAPILRETMLGTALILEIFNISKVGKIAGCRVTDGTVERGANVRLIRDNVVIHEGKLSQLKRFKDDAREVVAGQECGMSFENYQDMRVGDVIECYRVETVQRTL